MLLDGDVIRVERRENGFQHPQVFWFLCGFYALLLANHQVLFLGIVLNGQSSIITLI